MTTQLDYWADEYFEWHTINPLCVAISRGIAREPLKSPFDGPKPAMVMHAWRPFTPEGRGETPSLREFVQDSKPHGVTIPTADLFVFREAVYQRALLRIGLEVVASRGVRATPVTVGWYPVRLIEAPPATAPVIVFEGVGPRKHNDPPPWRIAIMPTIRVPTTEIQKLPVSSRPAIRRSA